MHKWNNFVLDLILHFRPHLAWPLPNFFNYLLQYVVPNVILLRVVRGEMGRSLYRMTMIILMKIQKISMLLALNAVLPFESPEWVLIVLMLPCRFPLMEIMRMRIRPTLWSLVVSLNGSYGAFHWFPLIGDHNNEEDADADFPCGFLWFLLGFF